MASIELLNALSTGANTVTTVASALGLSRTEAEQQLSAATARGFLLWEDADGRFTDVVSAGRSVRLSTPGLEELHRLRVAAAGR